MNKTKPPLNRKLTSALAAALLTLCCSSATVSAITVSTAMGTGGADAELSGWTGADTNSTSAADSANGLNTLANIRTTTNRNEVLVMRFDLTGYTLTDYSDYGIELINQRTNGTGATLRFYGVADNAVAEDNHSIIRGYTDDTWVESPLEFSTMPGMHWTNSSTAQQVPNASATLLGSVTPAAVNEGTVVSFGSAALVNFIRTHPDQLITIIVQRGDAGSGQTRFTTREASATAANVLSGAVGDFAPRLTFGNPFTSVTWTGPGTDWNQSTNWFAPVVPTNGISANIPAGFTVNFNTPAPDFPNLTNASTLNINATGLTNTFTWGNVATALFNVNNNGQLIVNGTLALFTGGGVNIAPGGVVNATSLLIGSGSTGGTGNGTANSYGKVTNDGGILISGDTRLNPGNASLANSTATDASPLLLIRGGYNQLGSVNIARLAGSTTAPNTLGRDGVVISNGVVDMTSLSVGNNAHGTVLITSGTITNHGATTLVNSTTNRPSRFIQSGGLYIGQGDLVIAPSGTGSAFVSLFGGTNVFTGIQLGGAGSATGSARLTNSSAVYIGANGITYNGAALIESSLNPGGLFGAEADWNGSASLKLGAGVFTFRAAARDGTAHNITYTAPLTGTGPLVKTGGGTLTLDAAHTYSDKTIINAGTLAVGASGTLSSSEIYVNSNAVFDVTATSFTVGALKTVSGFGVVTGAVTVASTGIINPGTNGVRGALTIGGSLSQSGGAVTHFDLSSNPSSSDNDVVILNGDLNTSGANTLEITGGGPLNSVHPLFKYTGTFNGTVSDFAVSGATGYITNITTTTPKSISLVIAANIRAATNTVWVGNSATNDWDVLNVTNWLAGSSLTYFVSGDNVKFNATGAANPNVNIPAVVSPGSVTVDATANYSLSGAGNISGANTLLTKTNSGKLTILTANSYQGATVISGGTLSIPSVANGGDPSPIGSASVDPSKLVIDSGILEYTSTSSQSTDRGATIGTNGATIRVTNASTALTISGTVTGTGALTKTGNGTLTLAGVNAYAGANLLAGTLQINSTVSALAGTVTFNGGSLRLTVENPSKHSNPLNITNGTLSFNGGNKIIDGPWSGSGTLNVDMSSGGILTIDGDMTTNFTGAIVLTDSSTGTFRFNAGGNGTGPQQATASAYAAFDLGNSTVTLGNRNGGGSTNGVYGLGALSGGPSTILKGNLSNQSGDRSTYYSIGAKNLSTTFAGQIQDGVDTTAGLTSIIKVGTGKLTLSGNSTYTGTTTVSNGTLQVDGSLAATPVTVDGGTLAGAGTIGGPVTVNAGGNLAPGSNTVGTLTVNGNLTLSGNFTVEVNRTNTQTADLVTGIVTNTLGGTLTIVNSGPTPTLADTFQLFSAGTYQGAFASITPLSPGPGLIWDTNTLASDGILRVAAGSVAPSATNITFTKISSSQLVLSWPAGQGWKLQTQTNALSVGLRTNWVEVVGATPPYTNTVSAAPQATFFRLVYP